MPIELTMPRLSDTMESGTIIKWNVKEGDEVSAGDVVADVETDKATMEMQVYDDGKVAKILVEEGKSVPVGTAIAVLAEEDEDVEAAAASAKSDKAEAKADKSSEPDKPAAKEREKEKEKASAKSEALKQEEDRDASEPKRDESPAAQENGHPSGDGRIRISPMARRLADEHGIDVRSIDGSGPGGRVIKRDIEKAIEAGEETAAAVAPAARRREPSELATRTAPAPAPMPAGLESRTIELSNMRQTIARQLVESKTTIPHYQVSARFNMDPLLELRETLNEQLEPQAVKLSVNDFLVRACALAMHEHPEFNASWADNAIEIHGNVNIGVAISLPRERGGGLVVATIRDADQKSLRQISAETRALAEKARIRGLSVEDMSDSTFTVSNLGMFGVEHFTAIINPPNSAILAVGAAIQQPVVRDGELAVGHEMIATLSCDHRVIDGAMAAQYMQTLQQLIESPATLLV